MRGSEDYDTKLRARLLKVCAQIRRLDAAVRDTYNAGLSDNSLLRDQIESASHLLLEAAERAEGELG